LPDGSPAGGVSVYLATQSRGISIRDGRPIYPDRVLSTTADAEGAFRFPPQEEPGDVVVLDGRGFARRAEDASADAPLILSPWGRVSGVVRVNGEPAPFAEVNIDVRHAVGTDRRIHFNVRDVSDAQGRYAIDHIPPGEAAIARGIPTGSNSVGFGPWQSIRVEPGETLEVTVGGEGRPVTGRLVLPEGLALDWRRPGARLDLASPPGPEIPEGLSPEVRQDWYRRWIETEEGRAFDAWQRERRSYPVLIAADSSFRVDDVRPGSYVLDVQLIDQETGEPSPARSRPIEIPEATGEAAHTPIDLGEVVLAVEPTEGD
jgi:hypothetical protein